MKPLTKNFLLVAAVLIGAGIILAVSALALGGFNPQAFNTGLPYEEKHYSYDSAKVKSLVVKDVATDVDFIVSPDDSFQITTYENEKERYDVTLSPGGELRIEYYSTKKWYEYIGITIQLNRRATTIAVPAKFIGEINASTVSGEITMNDIELQKALTVSSTSGSIRLENAVAGDALKLSTTSGEIIVHTAQAAGGVTASSISGGIMIDHMNASGSAKFSSTSGEISLDSSTCGGSITASTSSGSIRLDDTKAQGDADLHSTSGEITFKRFEANNISLGSVSGEVRGTLLGSDKDYTVDADTTSGDKDVPQSAGGSKKLKVNTTSGDISIRFES